MNAYLWNKRDGLLGFGCPDGIIKPATRNERRRVVAMRLHKGAGVLVFYPFVDFDSGGAPSLESQFLGA